MSVMIKGKEYIEREAARDLLDMALDDDWEIEYANDRLDEIPAADVVPVRHGRWIEREDMYYGWNIWECSACREEFCVEEGTPKDNEYNYCPNCGARMKMTALTMNVSYHRRRKV